MIATFLTVGAATACGGSADGPPSRSPNAPILGVTAPPGGVLPECAEPVVHRTPAVPVAELTVSGQQGDTFGYRIVRRDGAAITGTSLPFVPGQTGTIFTTGVANADIATVTITASGTVGIGGSCTITTIR